MNASTGQYFTERIFTVTGSTEPEMVAEATRLAMGFVAVATIPFKDDPINLPISQPLVETTDGVLTVSVAVDMEAWPDFTMFEQAVWDYFAANKVEVYD